MAEDREVWDFFAAAPEVPGVSAMVGYRAHGDVAPLHRGLPSARLTFIVALDEGVEAAATEEALRDARPAPLVLGGLHTATAFVRQRRGEAGVQLAVHPLAARALFGVPAAELSVTDFDAAAALGRWGEELRGRTAEAPGWSQALAEVARQVLRRHDEEAYPRPELRQAWRLLERSGGRMAIGRLAREVALSPRHLGTLFRREVGRSPKAVAGLMRFERATAAIAAQARRHGRPDLARIAADGGFADQAHLSREFTGYAGISPTAWVAQELRNIQDGAHERATG